MKMNNNNTIKLGASSYKIINKATANISDSFVKPANKVGSGSGEARLYVSTQSKLSEDSFFNFHDTKTVTKGKKSYHGCSETCFLYKDNLIKYMEDSYVDYHFPKQNHRKDISLLYDKRLNNIKSLNATIEFNIFNQDGKLDEDRFYIGSSDNFVWNDILRQISLPKITKLNIYKLINVEKEEDIKYYFELVHILNKNTDIKYSKNKTENKVEQDIKNDTSIDSTQKETLIVARKGQGKFRKNTLRIMPKCPFTGISEKSLLRASHIIPWRECENNEQRLSGYNGLSLTPTYDVLFDLGLISFENNGKLLISSHLSPEVKNSLFLDNTKTYNIYNTHNNKDKYLEYHRIHIFKQ
ncbi:MAG: hypothetical protein FH753_06795 [Firmicutes bacterium]|nr:hypothetical protein [Bacillota bacterium]